MKTGTSVAIAVFLTAIFIFSPCVNAEESERSFGFVQNLGSGPVYVAALRTDGSTVVMEVGGLCSAILPANTTRVSALPTYFTAGQQSVSVAVLYQHEEAGQQPIGPLNGPGEKVDLPHPSDAIPSDFVLPGGDEGRVVIPREAYLPGQSPQEIREREQRLAREELDAQRDIDERGDPFLRRLNEDHMRYRDRLPRIDPDSEEAGAIRDALPQLEEIINDRIEVERQKYGEDWLERYRDPATGELPGGLLSYERVLDEPAAQRIPGVITGRVYTRGPREGDNWGVQRIFTVGPAMTLGPIMEWPLKIHNAGEGFNVLWNVIYCELDDASLFDKFKRLVHTQASVNERLLKDDRKITKQEFNDCQELLRIKNKVLSSAKWKEGALPGWRTATDAEGRFTFALDEFPGKGNIIFLILNVAAFPSEGQPTPFFTENQTPAIGTAEFPLILPRARFIPESEIPLDLLRACPAGTDPAELERKMDEKKEQLLQAEQDLAKLQKEDIRPSTLEERWQDRASKDQRAFQTEYTKQHGDSADWTPEIRSRFEKGLAEIPARSRTAWEQEAAAYSRKREETIGVAQKRVDLSRIDFSNLEKNIEERDRKLELWNDRVTGAIGDVSVILPEQEAGTLLHTFEKGGDIAGDSITPPLRSGYVTYTYLVKQVIDDTVRTRPVIGKFSVTGEPSAYYSEAPGSPKPPFVFDFGEDIKKHLVINDFVNTFRGSNDKGVGMVVSMFSGLTTPAMLNGRLEQFFVPLPGTVEVEGYPIKNSKNFHAGVDAQMKMYRDATDSASREVERIMRERKNGKITTEQVNSEYMQIYLAWTREIRDIMAKIGELTRNNPAFK
jgi:hypothetical protein